MEFQWARCITSSSQDASVRACAGTSFLPNVRSLSLWWSFFGGGRSPSAACLSISPGTMERKRIERCYPQPHRARRISLAVHILPHVPHLLPINQPKMKTRKSSTHTSTLAKLACESRPHPGASSSNPINKTRNLNSCPRRLGAVVNPLRYDTFERPRGNRKQNPTSKGGS
jgi:hypothetical protein